MVNANESSVLVLLEDRVALTTATTPLVKAVAFVPLATQVTVPEPGAQVSVSPEGSADPAVMLTEEMAVGANERVHCRLAGALVAAVNERLSESEAPLSADPEARLIDGACAKA